MPPGEHPSRARSRHIGCRDRAHLAEAVAKAAPGDRLMLAVEAHSGRSSSRSRLTLEGRPGAIVDAGGTGTALRS